MIGSIRILYTTERNDNMLMTYRIHTARANSVDTVSIVNALYDNTVLPDRKKPGKNKVYNDFSYPRYKTTEIDTAQFAENKLKKINNIHQTKKQIEELTDSIQEFLAFYKPADMYYTFKMPKRTGGFREINAPNEILMEFMRELQPWFAYKLNCLPHDSAYAYIHKRDCNKALQRHQAIKPNWFLKLDIEKFFDNCDGGFIKQQLRMLYPFALMTEDSYNYFANNLIELITKDNSLPQGTPLSPVITNLIMVAIDRDINRMLNKYFKDKNQSFMYTRYADDMLISSNKEMQVREVVAIVNEILSMYTSKLRIKKSKTRYGSKAGSNWNLGIMYNKDNKLTVGYKRKKKIKTMLFQFIICYNENTQDKEYAQAILGELAYMNNIEPEYTENLIQFMNKKYDTDFYSILYKTVKEK